MMEWNRIEWKGKQRKGMSKKGEEKEREQSRSVIGPQGAGPCAREGQYRISVSGSDKWTGPTSHEILRSHEVLGVMSS